MNEMAMLYIALVLSVFSTVYVVVDVVYFTPTHIENEQESWAYQKQLFTDLINENERQDAMLEWMFQTLCNEHTERCSEAFAP